MSEAETPVVVDLGIARRGEINESQLAAFGANLQIVLDRMFGASTGPISIRGTRAEVKEFANALKNEKNYMRSYQKYGLSDPRTFANKYKLDSAIRKFEQETNIKWPIK
jgi:hypothetical protein